MSKIPDGRLASIDVFRAVTMFLMIFVNDLWTLTGIPRWLLHTEAMEDGMGLSDAVFPAFLFIVGLSIPYAIASRREKGASSSSILQHVAGRAIALLIMGLFHVNLGNYGEAAFLPRWLWQILITVSFFLIWLDFPKQMSRTTKVFIQGLGATLLLFLAAVYQNDSGGWMTTQWWGILGLIGWAYLIAAVIHCLSPHWISTLVALLFFLLFNIAAHAQWLSALAPIRKYIWLVGDGSMPALVMAGVLTAQLYRSTRPVLPAIAAMAILFTTLGFVLRPFWGISKIMATPSWVMICTGISLLLFGLLIVLVDQKKKAHWFSILRPAGTSTLTAYLLPYMHYALYSWIGISLPLFWRTGWIGIIKCLLYALLIILITGWLEKKRLRLKI